MMRFAIIAMKIASYLNNKSSFVFLRSVAWETVTNNLREP